MRFRLLTLVPTAILCLAFSSPLAAAPGPVHAFDAAEARPVELAREAQRSPAGALFRITGLLGASGEPLTLDLESARLFADDFRLYVDGKDRGADVVARLAFLRGTVEEMPGSSVALTLDGATGAWSGYIVAGEAVYEIALPAGVAGKSLASSATVHPVAMESIAKGAFSDALKAPSGAQRLPAPREKVVVPPGLLYQASIAIDSDFEMYAMFGSVESATNYLATLIAGVSELYVRQLGVGLNIVSLSLYTTADDPWNAPNPHSGDSADVLCEFSSYWQRLRPVKNFPRNGAMFFTGKASNDISGQAFLAGLCNYTARPSNCPYGGYGIVVISRRTARDVFVTAHELGHVFGSDHTHCYNPPIDMCHSGEEGCYEGPQSTPSDGGSVMSYCSPASISLGEPGRFGLDSQRVEEVIGNFVNHVGPTCLSFSGAYELAGEAATGSATLSWTDPFTTETNWLVEQRQKTGKFTQIKSLPKNATSVTLTKLKHGSYVYRVRPKFRRDFGVYSDAVTVTVP